VGVEFIDYIIADDFVIPAELETAYAERVLRMPHSFMPNDRRRASEPVLTRNAYGLPENGFVFVSFNQTVKITPEIFAHWMNLLRRVEGSVLWLLEDNRWASANLRAAAEDHGIAPERLVIAPRLPTAQHLARYHTADLALDTFPYGSHTTGCDVLWGGCPLIALCGSTFAARVSGSLLRSCGLSDLITHTPDEAEALAYRLATDGAYMKDVRGRLAQARESAPLFDSTRFVRDLEQLYIDVGR
jgi:predicted O-linked N-acetylglucosamine transferase (SPINDLY family)